MPSCKTNVSKEERPTEKGRENIKSNVAIVFSTIGTIIAFAGFVLSYSSSQLTINPDIDYSAPDSSVVEELNNLKVAVPSVALKITNQGDTDIYNLQVVSTNANEYFLHRSSVSSQTQILTRLPRLEKGDYATILFYPSRVLLNGLSPTKVSLNNEFNGSGEIATEISYSYEGTNVFGLKKSMTKTRTIKVQQKKDASSTAAIEPATIMPDSIDGKIVHKDVLSTQLPNTGK